MLEPAIKYKKELEEKYFETWFEEKYKYYHESEFFEAINIQENSEKKHEFVSTKDGKILGFIHYDISRSENKVTELGILSFEPSSVFAVDLKQALVDIFEKFNFEKINFSVVIGNPVEKTYDRIIAKNNGRIIGTFKKDVRLYDGQLYDRKFYEITKEEYFSVRNNNERIKESYCSKTS